MCSRVVFAAGVVSYDYLIYPMTAFTADGQHAHVVRRDEPEDQEVALVVRTGSADLVAQLLTAAGPQHEIHVLRPPLQPPASNALKHNASSVCDLSLQDQTVDGLPTYRITRLRQIGRTAAWHAPSLDKGNIPSASTVVITGSGQSLRDVEPALDFLQKVRPRYLIHYMTRPLATGPLWDVIRNGPMTRDGVPEPDFLAVVVDADDLRAEGISLSHSLSWEATAEDFVRNLGSQGRLDTLVTCPNLIVRFGAEGVIHHRGRDAVDPKLYYHPRKMESERREGVNREMLGLSSAFTAGLALGFAGSKPPNCDKGIRFGLSTVTRLAEYGFVQSAVDGGPDYPIARIMQTLSPDKQHAAVSIPSSRISSGDKWSIFEAVTGDPKELARQIVTLGPEKALAACPVQRFGKLLVVERAEQENLRAVIDAVKERLNSSSLSPTSIGISGLPGSGKKFTIANMADHIAGDKAVHRLNYNARLLKSEDLIAACHKIRDFTSTGELTIVCFENFESVLEAGNNLLDDFVAIMRDGQFADKGHLHSLGRPLLFFIVNHETTTLSVAHTPITPVSDSRRDRTDLNESALFDNLHGIMRVLGPNQISAEDNTFPVRRAMMLRQLLTDKYPLLVQPNGRVSIEEGVLHALLLVPSFKHGLRSLEKIISTSRLSHKTKFDVAALPPEEQIQLHTEGKIFMSYLRSPKLPPALRERLAQGLYETYKQRRVDMCKSDEERKALESDRSMRDWDELAPELKESTRAQADDIPRKLRAVGCFMLDQDRDEPLVRVPQFSAEELDTLSEIEHERFNAERLQRQWKMGPRNSKQRTTPFLVPWRDLTQEWKDVDRVMVECVPRLLEKAGWKIYRMREVEL